MKFYKLDEVPVHGDDQVFKTSPIRIVLGMFMFLGVAIAVLVFDIRNGKLFVRHTPPEPSLIFFAACFGLIALFLYRSLRTTRRPTNWLLRCNGSGVIIKFRSYQNWRLPSDTVQAVGFDYSEIAWVRNARGQRISPTPGRSAGAVTSNMTYVDLGLVNADTSSLEARLSAERCLQPDGVVVSMDYPVQVLPGGIVELRWSGGMGGIHPPASKAIETLSRHVKTAGADSREVDLTHDGKLSPEEERAKIAELAKRGDKMGAVKLTRQIHGYSLGEAHEFVEKLLAGH